MPPPTPQTALPGLELGAPPRVRSKTRRALAPAPTLPTVHARELRGMSGDVTKHIGHLAWGWHLPGAERPAILAIDTGAVTGWAMFRNDGRFVRGGEIRTADSRIDTKWVSALAEVFHDFLELVGPGLVVVEDVFMLRNVKTLAHLAMYVGAVVALAADNELPALRIQPPTWQSTILGKAARSHGKHRRDQGKAVSLARARSEFGDSITSDHQADAALLGLYVRGPR